MCLLTSRALHLHLTIIAVVLLVAWDGVNRQYLPSLSASKNPCMAFGGLVKQEQLDMIGEHHA
jgi:hypothetical protein